MDKLIIEFDFSTGKAKLNTLGLSSEDRKQMLADLTKSIGMLKLNEDNIADLLLTTELMLQFTSSASFINTRCYDMQVKITDKLRDLVSKHIMGNLVKD